MAAQNADNGNAEQVETSEAVNLFDMATDNEDNGGLILPGLDDEQVTTEQPKGESEVDLFDLGNSNEEEPIASSNTENIMYQNQYAHQNNSFSKRLLLKSLKHHMHIIQMKLQILKTYLVCQIN